MTRKQVSAKFGSGFSSGCIEFWNPAKFGSGRIWKSQIWCSPNVFFVSLYVCLCHRYAFIISCATFITTIVTLLPHDPTWYCHGKSSVLPSVCNIEVLWSHRLEYFKNNFTTYYKWLAYAYPNITDLLQREHPQILARIGVEYGKIRCCHRKLTISLKWLKTEWQLLLTTGYKVMHDLLIVWPWITYERDSRPLIPRMPQTLCASSIDFLAELGVRTGQTDKWARCIMWPMKWPYNKRHDRYYCIFKCGLATSKPAPDYIWKLFISVLIITIMFIMIRGLHAYCI